MSASQFVTAKDQLKNVFTITVHKAILRRFLKAIRQRQIVLSTFGVPADVAVLVSPLANAPASPTTEEYAISTELYETLAFCFYHFISFNYWETSRSVKLWEVSKKDFEDEVEKKVSCFTSKLPVCNHSVVFRATVGYRVLHTVVWCCPAGAVGGMLEHLSSTTSSGNTSAPTKIALVNTSDKKVSMENDDKFNGTWTIRVTLSKPTLQQPQQQDGGLNTYSARQLADVADFQVYLKPRHDLNPLVVRYLAKLPTPLSHQRESVDDDDAFEELEEVSQSEDDQLFSSGPLRFAQVPVVLKGVLDPPPLPRDPTTYPLPANTQSGATIPDYVPYTITPPRVLTTDPLPSTYAVTPISMKTNQTFGRTIKQGDKEVPSYTQLVDITFQVLNKTEKPLVFAQPPKGVVCRKLAGDDSSVVLTARSTRWSGYSDDTRSVSVAPQDAESFTVRCEYEVIGRNSGSDNFERSLLDETIFPQPALFRLELEETHSGDKCTFELEQYNRDRELETRDGFLKSVMRDKFTTGTSDDILLYVSADDTDSIRRYSAAVYMETDGEEERMVIARRNSSLYVSLIRLQAAAYKCMMGGEERLPLTDFGDASVYRAWLCASGDVHPIMIFAIKVEVTTSTSTAVGYCHVKFRNPQDAWIATKRVQLPTTANTTTSDTVTKTSVNSGSSVSSIRDAIIRSGNTPFSLTAEPQPERREVVHQDPVANPVEDAAANSNSGVFGGMGQRAVSTSMGYRILYDHAMGSGAFGAVFKAFDLQNGRTVAVKETHLSSGTAGAPAAKAAAKDNSRGPATNGSNASSDSSTKEFDILKNLEHPNIVQVYELDVIPESRMLRVFMEWVTGGSISSVLRQQHFRLHENVVRHYARDALKGLAYLHGKGILHLDVKPANMLVTHQGAVKLGDFGTTMFLNKAAGTVMTGQTTGTPAYMAPEIISSGKFYRGSDIWAWACSVIEMASGELPWSHLPPEKHAALPLMFHIATAKPPAHCPLIPEHLSASLKEILMACFSPSLSLRPSAEALLGTEYFSRDTLPLDVEPLESYYEQAQEASELADSSAGDSSWVAVGTVGSQDNNTRTL